MHNCRSTRQQQLQKEEITRNRSDNESLSFRSITKTAAIHNPHTTQEITDRKQVVCRAIMEGRKTHNSNLIFLFYFYFLILIFLFLFYYCILISFLSFRIPDLKFLFLLLYFNFNT